MPKFRRRPVVIEAIQVRDVVKRMKDGQGTGLPSWLRDALKQGVVTLVHGTVLIETAEGQMRGNEHAWIARGVEGELYPIKASVFQTIYEPLGEPEALP